MSNKRGRLVAASLQEYIQIIKEKRLENHISRGENKKYPLITAAAFRGSDHLDIQEMVADFENYIGNELTELQRKHFMAFSQHYGLPTNLLDFTYSPLISLYFACSGNPEGEGYVYFLDKRRQVDLTRHVEYICPGMLNRLILAENEDNVLFEKINHIFCVHEEYGMELLRCIDHMLGDLPGNGELRAVLRGTVKKAEEAGGFSIDWLGPVVKIMKRRLCEVDSSMKLFDGRCGFYNSIFVCAMRLLLLQGFGKSGFFLPIYFTYEPANIASRVSSQSSILIYQLYGINTMRQFIRPDTAIQIQNKEAVLEDLDLLGINEKFIFNDYDHIASYIKKKHLKTAEEMDKKWENLNYMVKALCTEGDI